MVQHHLNIETGARFMRFWKSAVLVTALGMGIAGMAAPAAADLVVTVNKSTQRMSVSVDGQPLYTWVVSTGVHGTPSGTFRPQSLSRYHRSSLFNNAPMPYSIFYDGHYAIHGTNQVGRLGRPASKGCVRLHPSNAAILFALVQKQGMGNTRIQIQ
jgi:lipoprotein-anchoring transpeptidase ErfK/SrfK